MADRSSLLASIQAGKSLEKVATVDKSAVKGAGGVVGQPGEKPVPEKADESEPDLKSLKAQLSSMFGGPPMPSPKRATSSVGADSTATATAMPPLAPPPLAPPSLAPPALTPPPLAPPHQHSPHGHRWLPHRSLRHHSHHLQSADPARSDSRKFLMTRRRQQQEEPLRLQSTASMSLVTYKGGFGVR